MMIVAYIRQEINGAFWLPLCVTVIARQFSICCGV